MERKIKRVGRTLAYEGKILKVYSDEMRISGKAAHWDYIDLKGGAAVVPVLENGNILLVKQYRNAIDDYSLEIPGGIYDATSEPGEVCAGRELLEETGYMATEICPLIQTHSLVAFTNEKVSIYVATGLTKKEQRLDEEEDIEVLEFSIEELKKMLYAGKITDSKTVAGLFAYISRQTSI